MNHTAYLSNDGEYTFFTFGDRTISFLTSRNLEKYLEIVEWDHGYIVVGYIVVLSKNYNREQEEDYIDLIPILKNLLIEPNAFLEPIKEVKVRYA